jgi:hypothetical protein
MWIRRIRIRPQHWKYGLVSKESLFLTDMLEEILEKLPAMLRSVSAGSIQVFIPDPVPDFLPMPDPGSRNQKKGTRSRIRMCQRHRWCTLSCEYLCEFSKKLERDRWYSEAWGKLIHEKNLKSKSRGTVPLIFSETVLRIRDVYPGSDFFVSRIPDPNCLHPGSASKNLSTYFNPPQKNKKMVAKL